MNTNTTLRNTLQAVLLTVTLLLGISAAQAQLVTNNITVQNYSFESPVTADYINADQGLYGWQINATVSPNTYIVRNGGGTVNYTSGVVGNQALFLEPWADGTPHVWQNLGEAFAAGTYTLSVNVGQGNGFGSAQGGVENATASFQLLSFNGSYNYNVGVAATTVTSAQISNTFGSLATYTFTLNLSGQESFIGDEIVIFLGSNKNTSTFQNISYDNVQLTYVTQAIPEPSTCVMLMLGIIAVGIYYRRRRA